jgi:hypothetical protein
MHAEALAATKDWFSEMGKEMQIAEDREAAELFAQTVMDHEKKTGLVCVMLDSVEDESDESDDEDDDDDDDDDDEDADEADDSDAEPSEVSGSGSDDDDGSDEDDEEEDPLVGARRHEGATGERAEGVRAPQRGGDAGFAATHPAPDGGGARRRRRLGGEGCGRRGERD